METRLKSKTVYDGKQSTLTPMPFATPMVGALAGYHATLQSNALFSPGTGALPLMSVPCNESAPMMMNHNPFSNPMGSLADEYEDEEDDQPDGGAEDLTHSLQMKTLAQTENENKSAIGALSFSSSSTNAVAAAAATVAAAAAAAAADGGGAGGGDGGAYLGKRRKRTNMSRDDRKKEDIQKLMDHIESTNVDLKMSLKNAMGEVVFYPNSDPSRPANTRDILREYLPVGTDIDPLSLRKNRDPHVHYAFYESECLFVTKQIDQGMQALQALKRHLLQQIRLYRYRLCNNCRKVWSGPVDLLKSNLSPYQEQTATATNNQDDHDHNNNHDHDHDNIIDTSGASSSAKPNKTPLAKAASSSSSKPPTTSSIWNATESVSWEIPKTGAAYSLWQSRGIISLPQPTKPKASKKRSRELLAAAAATSSAIVDLSTTPSATAAATAVVLNSNSNPYLYPNQNQHLNIAATSAPSAAAAASAVVAAGSGQLPLRPRFTALPIQVTQPIPIQPTFLRGS